MILNTKLKNKREEKGLTQAEIAYQAKVSLRAYQYYENGERVPDVLTAILIVGALNSTVEELFNATSLEYHKGK